MLTTQQILDKLATVSYIHSTEYLNFIDLYRVLFSLRDLCQTEEDHELLLSVCKLWSLGREPSSSTGDVVALLKLLLIR